MIDFRFFIISVVAVFLALGLGIVMGSGFFRDPFVSQLESRVEGVFEREEDLRDQILDLEDLRDAQRDFLELVEPTVVNETLAGEEVVFVDVEGSESALMEGMEQVLQEADAAVPLRIRLTNKLRLEDDQATNELATILDSISPDPNELRALLGLRLGERVRQAALPLARLNESRDRSQTRARAMLTALEEKGFVTFPGDGLSDIPQGARFLLAAGGNGVPQWPAEETLEALGSSLGSESDLAVVVAESASSQWQVAQSVRTDSETSDVVSTVDNADTIQGRIGTVLGLSLAPQTIGHWGNDEGATAPAPTPPPG